MSQINPQQLVLAYLDGRLSAEQVRLLDQWLAHDEQAPALYWSIARIHTLLNAYYDEKRAALIGEQVDNSDLFKEILKLEQQQTESDQLQTPWRFYGDTAALIEALTPLEPLRLEDLQHLSPREYEAIRSRGGLASNRGSADEGAGLRIAGGLRHRGDDPAARSGRLRNDIFNFAGIRISWSDQPHRRLLGLQPRFFAYAAALLVVVTGAWMYWSNMTREEAAAPQTVAEVHQDAPTSQPAQADPGAPGVTAAIVGRTVSAQWDQAGTLEAGVKLRAGGQFTLNEGFIEIVMERGARVVLEAPCVVQLIDDNSLHMDHGRLFAHIPQQATRFSVFTPTGRVLDIGTELGVIVHEDGTTEAHVYEGLAELHERDREGRAWPAITRLSAGWGAVVQSDGVLDRNLVRVTERAQPRRSWEEVLYVPTVSGKAHWLHQPPQSLLINEQESDEAIIFLERQNVRLQDAQPVVAVGPGLYEMFRSDKVIAAGNVVDSYLVHFDPPGTALQLRERGMMPRVQGTIRFSRPIVGVIAHEDDLVDSNARLGHPDARYHTTGSGIGLGLEFGVGDDGDLFEILDDGRTLVFTLRAVSIDQIRILIQAADTE